MTDPQLDAAERAFRAAYLDPGLMRHALRKALKAADKAAWRPVETAPRDGQWVMLWWPRREQFPVFGYFEAGRWHSRYTLSFDGDPQPTHWLSIPAPPESAQ